jgi:hypothetical protein
VPVPLLEEVLHLQPERTDDVLSIAAGKALEERPAVVALGNGETRLPVFMGWAQSLPRTIRLTGTV